MRVLLLLDNFNEDGPGNAVYRLCQRWVPMREVTITAIGLGGDGPNADRLRSLGINARSVNLGRLRDFRALKELGKQTLFRAHRPDVVHSHGLWPDVPARLFHDGNPYVPLLTTIYGFKSGEGLLQPAAWRIAERSTRKHARRIVTGSLFAENTLLKLGVPGDMLERIPLGIDAVQCFPLSENTKSRFRALIAVPNGVPLIVSVAEVSDDRGQLDLLAAMPAILKRHSHTRLFIVADPAMHATLEPRIAQAGLGDAVRLISQLAETLSRLLSTADVVVHPSRKDSFTSFVAEAQACGTPVVATRTGDTQEIIVEDQTGILVDPGNPEALANSISRLLDDAELRRRMGEAARERMSQSLEISDTASQYAELWREIAPEASWKSTDSIPPEELEALRRDSSG